MFISEIFHSIQGEGLLTGVPSVFIRTSGCNLRCRWCDTPYTSWSPDGKERSVDEIMADIAGFPSRHTVITGGEPLLMKDLPQTDRKTRRRGIPRNHRDGRHGVR